MAPSAVPFEFTGCRLDALERAENGEAYMPYLPIRTGPRRSLPKPMSGFTASNSHGHIVLERRVAADDFTCDRCQQSKKAKVRVNWTLHDGTERIICNGFYGTLRAEG